ncbi:hypothetical protein GCM10027294_43830 [Marinactinospora endophytica]
MPSAGSVHVDVLPDLKKFGPQLRSQLTQLGRAAGRHAATASSEAFAKQWTASIGVDVDAAGALTQLATIEAAVDRLDGRRIRLTVDAPTATTARTQVAGLRGELDLLQRAALAVGPALTASLGVGIGGASAAAAGVAAAGSGIAGLAAVAIPSVMGIADALSYQEQAAQGSEAAVRKYNRALSEMSPAAQRLMADYEGFAAEFGAWQQSLEPTVLPRASRALAILGGQFGQFTPVVQSAAGGVDQFMDSAQSAFASPEWRSFTSFLARQAGPSIAALGDTAINTALGLTGLIVAAEPLWSRLAPGLEELSARFATWANDTQNFTGFIGFVLSDGPLVVDMLTSIGGALIDVGVALAPLGSVYLSGLTLLADTVGAVADHAPWLLQLAVAAGTARMALSLLGAVNTTLLQPLRALPERIAAATDQLRDYGTVSGQAVTNTGRFQGAVSNAVGVLGGPWGVAITAGVTALGMWIASQQQAAARTDELTRALQASNGAIDANVQKVAAQTLQQEGALDLARQLGIDLQLVTDAYLGNADAAANLNRELDRLRREGTITTETLLGTQTSLDQTGHTAETLSVLMGELTGDMDASTQAQLNLAAATGGTSAQQDLLTGSLTSGALAATDMKTALDALTATNLSAAQAELGWYQAVTAATEAVTANGAATDLNTAAGQANRQALLGMATAANSHLVAMQENGAGADTLTSRQEAQRKKFVEVAKQMGLTAKEARELADDYLGIPDEISTAIRVNARGTWTLSSSGEEFSAGGNNLRLYASGGPVLGPGTGTSDSIPAMLSNGEHVWTAAEVNAVGGQAAMYRLRAAARTGQIPAFARGGAVTTTGTGPTAWDQIDDHREDVRLEIQRLITSTVDGVATDVGAQLRRLMSQGGIGAVQRAASQLGLPYSWGGGGPGGPSRGFGRGAAYIGFDCSSLMQYAWWPWVKLPRVTYDQIRSGIAVPTGQQRPGDLVFPHLGHVAMYAGGGRLIHAPYTGANVSYRSMYASPLAIRRPVRGLATGGLTEANEMFVAGEQGPELIQLRDPARVYSHQESLRMVREGRRTAAVRGGDGAAAPLIGTNEIHLHDSQATVREAMSELTHTLRVVRKGGLYGA